MRITPTNKESGMERMIPVVITGRGLITPIGLSLAENLESLKTGKSGIKRDPHWQEIGRAHV